MHTKKTTALLLTILIGLNEMVLAAWLIIRGFQSPEVGSELELGGLLRRERTPS